MRIPSSPDAHHAAPHAPGYRSVSELGLLRGKLTHAAETSGREHRLPWLKCPVAWYSTAQLAKHGEATRGSSFYNRAEISAISSLLHRMERTYLELGEVSRGRGDYTI